MKISHKSFSVAILLIVILLGSGVYYLYSKSRGTSFAEYKSTKYNYSFSYPSEWKVEDYGGPGPEGVIVTDPATKDSVYISYNERLESTSMSAPVEKKTKFKRSYRL